MDSPRSHHHHNVEGSSSNNDVIADVITEPSAAETLKKQKLEQELEDKQKEIERLKMQLNQQRDYEKLKREVQ